MIIEKEEDAAFDWLCRRLRRRRISLERSPLDACALTGYCHCGDVDYSTKDTLLQCTLRAAQATAGRAIGDD